MKNTNTQIADGTTVTFKNEEYVVMGYAKGWYELANSEDGTTAKGRAKDIKPVETGPRDMGKTLLKYRAGYTESMAYSGRKSLNNHDFVAQFLDGMSPEETLAAAERILGLNKGELSERYGHLNPGSRRMNGGNLIRFAVKRGDITMEDVH